MPRHPLTAPLLLVAAAALLSSCATTTLTSRWRDRAFEGSFQSVLVVAIADSEHHRRLFEDEFVRQLEQRGIDARASFRVLPRGQVPEQAQLEEAVRRLGLDAMLATHMLDVSREYVYHPPVAYYDYPYYYRHWGSFVEYTYQPGYYTAHTSVTLETNLYAAADGRLVWSGQTETFDPITPEEVVTTLCGVVLGELQAQGLLR
jgi:hypothetical protein